jgi:hypothetical protein
MQDLLDWISQYNVSHPPDQQLHFAGYSFHVLNDGATCESIPIAGCPAYPFFSPTLVADRVNRLRNLLAQYPALLPAQIEVNEFDSANRPSQPALQVSNQLIPGWQAGYIASFERSNVDFAGLGCWYQYYSTLLGLGWNTYDQCLKGLDGLLADGNNPVNPNSADYNLQPQAIFWVYSFYSEMTGVRIATSSATTDLSAFATRDDSTSTLKALVGRHKRCSVDTARDPTCPAGGDPADVTVQVSWPYPGTTIHYTVQQIPDVGNGLGGPCTTLPSPNTGTAAISGGIAKIPLPAVQDGDAYTLVLRP